jgi:hypothetical protein
MGHVIDEFGIQRSTLTGLTPEGRRVPPGTTIEEYRAMLAEEQVRWIAAVERQNDPRLPRPPQSRLPRARTRSDRRGLST